MTGRAGAGLRAAVALARSLGLSTDGPAVLADGGSLMVHLRPAPVVARVATWLPEIRPGIQDWLDREIRVAQHLAGLGFPAVAPSAELPPGPHHHDGHWISFWTWLEPDPGRAIDPDTCSAMLVDLHRALGSYPGDLPVLAPAVNDIPLGMAALDSAVPILTTDEVARVRDLADELAGFARDPGVPLAVLHGDAHPGNLHPTRDGPVWIDFEDVCRGPREWDLALLHWLDRWTGGSTVADHHDPDPDLLHRCSQLRAVHIIAALVLLPDLFGGSDDGSAAHAQNLRRMVGLALTDR